MAVIYQAVIRYHAHGKRSKEEIVSEWHPSYSAAVTGDASECDESA